MAQQTAVESFWNKIALQLSVEQINEFLPEFQQAKATEKEHLMMAFNDGKVNSILKKRNSEEYYNQTYNK